jgi:hypothetical protein
MADADKPSRMDLAGRAEVYTGSQKHRLTDGIGGHDDIAVAVKDHAVDGGAVAVEFNRRKGYVGFVTYYYATVFATCHHATSVSLSTHTARGATMRVTMFTMF